MTFKTLNNRVLVQPDEVNEKTSTSGIIIASKEEEHPVTGIVVVGNEDVKEGDKILFSKFGYDEVEIEGKKHYVVSDFNILGIF